jgi:hypothetical protein
MYPIYLPPSLPNCKKCIHFVKDTQRCSFIKKIVPPDAKIVFSHAYIERSEMGECGPFARFFKDNSTFWEETIIRNE